MRHGSRTLGPDRARGGLACRGGEPPSGERTASAYSTGADSEARAQRIEGTNTGVEYQTSGRIPGVLTTLDEGSTRAGKEENFTALRGNLGDLEEAMRSDLTRAGLADTGEFHALADSLAHDVGGGAGGLTDAPKPDQIARIDARVRRLIEIHQGMMKSVKK